jgi:hypothetical protein
LSAAARTRYLAVIKTGALLVQRSTYRTFRRETQALIDTRAGPVKLIAVEDTNEFCKVLQRPQREEK